MAQDDKVLTDLGLKEIETDTSPAVTDYILVIDPNTGVPTRVLLSAIKTLLVT